VAVDVSSLGGRPWYRPYRWGTTDFQLGLRPIKATEWLLLDADHAATMREKRARMMNDPDLYYRTLPGSLAAQYELRERVALHLAADFPMHFRRSGTHLHSLTDGAHYDLEDPSVEPLRQLSSFVEEDFMLIQEDRGPQVITAASNAYSSSGRLVASVGHDVAWAHEPVPQLTNKLGPRIDRIPCWRSPPHSARWRSMKAPIGQRRCGSREPTRALPRACSTAAAIWAGSYVNPLSPRSRRPEPGIWRLRRARYWRLSLPAHGCSSMRIVIPESSGPSGPSVPCL
jgi:hypothetical protein